MTSFDHEFANLDDSILASLRAAAPLRAFASVLRTDADLSALDTLIATLRAAAGLTDQPGLPTVSEAIASVTPAVAGLRGPRYDSVTSYADQLLRHMGTYTAGLVL
jgi:hypothetical protein